MYTKVPPFSPSGGRTRRGPYETKSKAHKIRERRLLPAYLLLLDSGSGWWRCSAMKELEEVTHTNGCLIWILEEHLNCRFKFSPPLLLDLKWRLRHLCKWSK